MGFSETRRLKGAIIGIVDRVALRVTPGVCSKAIRLRHDFRAGGALDRRRSRMVWLPVLMATDGGVTPDRRRPPPAGKVTAKMPCRLNKRDGDQWFDLVISWLASVGPTSNDIARFAPRVLGAIRAPRRASPINRILIAHVARLDQLRFAALVIVTMIALWRSR
jgi:hypothetical protein